MQIFLDKLKSFITRKDFNIDKDFFLNLNGDIKRERKYSTRYAMDVLEYDKHDVLFHPISYFDLPPATAKKQRCRLSTTML